MIATPAPPAPTPEGLAPELTWHRFPTAALADWLERDPHTRWVVGGEELLMQQISFPCLPGELAAALRRVPGEVAVVNRGDAPAEDSADLNDLVFEAPVSRNRQFFCWWVRQPGTIWHLTEHKRAYQLFDVEMPRDAAAGVTAQAAAVGA